MEEQFRVLLGACVAVSTAAAASACDQDVDTCVQSVDVTLGLTTDQVKYWDSLCGDSAPDDALSLVEDLALLLASTNVSANKLLSLLRVLLVHPSLHCAGLVRLAQMTLKGFKLAKRWDALNAVSTQLLDAIYAKILHKDTRERALRLYIEVLVGFQHSAELYEKNVTKIVKLAELFSEESEESKELVRPLLVACAALEHCHRGYEAEAMTLRRAMRASFGSHVDRPTAAEAERLLRSSAWVLSADELGAMLPSIEGKWVVDEFVSDQHGNGGPQNAGSVLLKTTNNCFAHEVKATMVDGKLQQKLELTGYLFQQMPEMQVLMAHPEAMEKSTWELEGHWRQLHEETGTASSIAPMAPISAPTWDCRACTMNNEGSATKCTTCGTERPADVNVPTVPNSIKGSNPAPFSAVFSSDLSFMRMKWSRGEQQGVWLARKQIVERSFDLATSLAAANDTMMDSTNLPGYVYSPQGQPASVLVLERAVLSTSDHTEFTVQVWIRPESSPSGNEAQIVLANGHNFELSLASDGHLVWQIAGGRYSLTSREPVEFGVFCHVTLSFGQDKVILSIDGSIAGEMERLDEAGPSAPGASLLTIGGSFESCDPNEKGKGPGCFYGQMLDLRIWSTLLSKLDENWSISTALTGHEGHLVGYYPLAGHSERLLMDLSKQQNHACVFEGYQAPDSIHDTAISSISSFVPATPAEIIPVKNAFAVSLGSKFFGSGKFSLSDDGVSGLQVDSEGALWRQNTVSIASGFQSTLSIAPSVTTEAQSSHKTVVFAMCEASFWDLVPLLSEAAKISNVTSDDVVDPSLRHFDGSAMLIKVSSDVVAPGVLMYELGLYIWSKKQGNPLSRVFRVAGGPSTASSDIQIKYELPGRVLSVAIGGVGVVFEVAVDLELALRMESGNAVRTGLIFPAGKDLATQQTATKLLKWTFESYTDSPPKEASQSVLGNVYVALQPEGSGEDSGKNSEGETITCTRVSTDGSAIAQEAYSCQTCSLVHGNSICRTCAVICHEGHELVVLGVTTTACACHVRGNGLCHCNAPVQVSEYPSLSQPVNAALWGCNKCTVINSIDLKTCNVCGNNAPEIHTGTGSAAPESTSTALALVEQPQPAVDWSCEACTMLNNATATKCSICDTPRAKPAEPEVVGASQETKTDDGLTTLYYAAENAVKQDHPMAIQPTGPWTCGACTMENQPADTTCHMCGTSREVPVAATVTSSEVVMTLPASTSDATPASSPMSMDMDGSDQPVTSEPVNLHDSKLKNIKYLDEYKRTAASAFSHLVEIQSMNDSVWETTGGKMHFTLDKSFVGEYVRGTYVEKDGKLSGLARLTEDGAWKLDGRFKKATQSQSNACTLYWDKTASRFDGKWYRGDGSGDWKCLASPYASDYCGLAPVDPVKKPNELQPYYSGMVNMKQNLTNVCYQNSFLQTLYMTQDFRRLILSCDASNYFAPFADNGTTSGGNVVATIQDLFAQMTASQRPYLATHALQRCLPTEFKNGRQQDTSDFAHFLIDSLSQQLSQHEDTTDDIPSIFGGHQATILACKTCGNKSVNREYFWELLLNMIDLRYTPITSITAVSGSSMDIKTPDRYERLDADLNKDRTGAPYVYLCVKRCPERATSDTAMEDDSERVMPVTELVVKVALTTDPKPSMPGFERVELDLNVGGGATAGAKKQVYLFFRREPNGSPITDLQVIYGNESVPDGFKQIQVDINQGDGSKVYLCYRCDMPITDLKIVNSGIPGYRMVDHLLNVSHEDAVKQYLALKVGGNEPCLTDLKLVEGNDVSTFEEQGWQSIGSPFSSAPVDQPTESLTPPQLMVRRGHGNPIFAVDVFRAPRQVPKYNDYEVIDLSPAGSSSDAAEIKGDWMGSEETDRGRKAVRMRSVSEPITDALLLKGSLDDKGELSCVATRVSSWSDSITAGAADSVVPVDSSSGSTSINAAPKVYRVSGYWKNAKVPSAQLFDVELRPAPNGVSGAPDAVDMSSQGEPTRLYTINGTIGDGRGKPIAIQGVQSSRKVKIKWPISSIMVLRGDERVPEGVQVVRETCSGRSGSLLAQTTSPHTLYLAVKREEAPADGYITDVCVIYGEIDAVPEHYTCLQTTPAGHSANLNDGTTGVPVFICYRRAGSTENAAAKSSMDLALMWTTGAQPDTLPTGFTKIQHTPLGMDANLNQGTSGVAIHLCYSKCEAKDIVKPLDNPLNGEFEITSSPLLAFGRFFSLSVVEELEEVRTVEGNFGIVLHAQLIGSMSGILYTSKHQQTEDKKTRTIVGAWRVDSPLADGVGASMNDFLPSSYPFELTLNETATEMDGWWSGAEGVSGNVSKPTVSVVTPSSGAATSTAPSGSTSVIGGKWKLVKDSYVHVAFKKDYSTEWKDGQLVFSERVWRHDIESMLSRFVATRTLGGDNALSCSVCQKKTESRTHTVIFEPPEHLIITLKRMYYDWTQQKACKCLHDVRFPALLTLPSLTEEEELAVYDPKSSDSTREKQQNQSRHYGLYGVLVHSGLTANSGHYFSFCRESDESTRQLHLEDSTLSPWIKFNDTKVERSNWKEINRLVSNTVSDTVYLLLYKKLSYEPAPSSEVDQDVSSDDEEAMLLAKAMALSMSAAKHQHRQNEEETKSEEDTSLLSTSMVVKTLLKKVEAENTTFLRDSVAATSSTLHADDIHTLLVLRHSLPLHLRAVLDEIC
ncbi:Ubiquitin carboxyl-terminal hydrolase domain-containing protein [Phytophthora infestans]|uniref:Ubiquitin carboxyl-terminal hydrolase domain-containing protein n=1 Tax=Phytophthora infestans TaxID=4787 RepID=A0A833WIJ9_PHYIN|nr:Ubiquitin carboxyl-terminal hydrolase domain-containing protein [Phytophthora infestans]